MKRDDIVSLV